MDSFQYGPALLVFFAFFAALTVARFVANRFKKHFSSDVHWRQSVDEARGSKDEACAVCSASGPSALRWVMPDAYRCNECGYEGGSGWLRQAERAPVDTWSSRPVAERRKAAMVDLTSARRVLLSAEADLERCRRKQYDRPAKFGRNEEAFQRYLGRTRALLLDAHGLVMAAKERAGDLLPEVPAALSERIASAERVEPLQEAAAGLNDWLRNGLAALTNVKPEA